MKKIKLFPKIFLFTFAMMLLISFIAHLLIFLIAPAQNVLVTNILVTNAGASTLSEVDMPRLITQTMLKTFPIRTAQIFHLLLAVISNRQNRRKALKSLGLLRNQNHPKLSSFIRCYP